MSPNQPLNRKSKLPLYQQLYEIMRTNIIKGVWKVGEMIPAEPELMQKHNVSRITVRQVLDMLVNEGLIYRQQGRGSFVAEPTLEQGLQRITSFTEDMRNRGLEPVTTVLESCIVSAIDEIAEKLMIEPGEELAYLKRLRIANGEPLSIEESFLVHKLCPGIQKHDYSRKPLREVLELDYGIRLIKAKQIIRSISANPAISKALGIPAKSPLLFIERVSYSQEEIPVEFLRIYYRADRYSLYSELHD